MSTQDSIRGHVDWYTSKRNSYKLLSQKVESIIKEILDAEGISIHATSSRAKTIDSFSKKIKNEKYTNPQSQITDFAGIRVIAYVESDVTKISQILRDAFEVDDNNSLDKKDELGIDKVGYRSVHIIAKLKAERLGLPEYKRFSDLYFEIQVRTILQHAWAEIEHDKNYKFSGKLDDEIKRRFKLLAGTLELADREFNRLANEIDEISTKVVEATKSGELDIPINSTTLKSYISTKFHKIVDKGLNLSIDRNAESIMLEEIKLTGYTTLKEIDDAIPDDFEKVFLKLYTKIEYENILGLIRLILMVINLKTYLSKAWRNSWVGLTPEDIEFLGHYNIAGAMLKKVSDNG